MTMPEPTDAIDPQPEQTVPVSPAASTAEGRPDEQTVPAATEQETARMLVNGVYIDLYEWDAFHRLAVDRLTSADGPALAVASINVDHLHHFGADRIQLPNIPEQTGVEWLFLADGAPIIARAAVLTNKKWPRMTGADLLPHLLGVAEQEGKSVGFLGGLPEVHRNLAVELHRRHPRLTVAGYWAPERSVVDDPAASRELAREIAQAKVDILVVGLGKPRQEQWIQNYAGATGSRLVLAFGASADFIAGKVARAPRVVRRLGLEWAYRLAKEPRRLGRRYLVEGPEAALKLRKATKLD